MNLKILINILILIPQLRCEDVWNEQFPEISAISLLSDNSIKLKENFTELQITGVSGILYYETLSKLHNVSKLKITNNRITEIENGAVCSPPNLKSLHLNFACNPDAPPLTKNVFRQCNLQLQEVFLRFDHDNSSKLDENALEDLHLVTLALQNYHIGHLREDFLKLKKNILVRLILSTCHIHSIEADVFDKMENLEKVEISNNRNLTSLPKRLFKNNLKLKSLSLKYNRIRELNWDEFEDLTFLEDLNLSGNRLVYFDAQEIFEAVPNLRRLELRKNLLPCKLKERLAKDLGTKFNSSVEVVYDAQACKN